MRFTIHKIQRVVVKESHQNLGIGSRMIAFCGEFARDQWIHSIYCHAIYTAVNFYVKNGYMAEGDYFDENNLVHLKMRKIL